MLNTFACICGKTATVGRQIHNIKEPTKIELRYFCTDCDKNLDPSPLTDEEKTQFVVSRGWTFSRLFVKKDSPGITMWEAPKDKHPDSHGMSLELAYHAAFGEFAEEIRAKAMKAKELILCNKCGEDVAKYYTHKDGEKRNVGYYGLVNAQFSTGYESKDLPDCNLYHFSICEKCMAALFQTFKIPPVVEFTL